MHAQCSKIRAIARALRLHHWQLTPVRRDLLPEISGAHLPVLLQAQRPTPYRIRRVSVIDRIQRTHQLPTFGIMGRGYKQTSLHVPLCHQSGDVLSVDESESR